MDLFNLLSADEKNECWAKESTLPTTAWKQKPSTYPLLTQIPLRQMLVIDHIIALKGHQFNQSVWGYETMALRNAEQRRCSDRALTPPGGRWSHYEAYAMCFRVCQHGCLYVCTCVTQVLGTQHNLGHEGWGDNIFDAVRVKAQEGQAVSVCWELMEVNGMSSEVVRVWICRQSGCFCWLNELCLPMDCSVKGTHLVTPQLLLRHSFLFIFAICTSFNTWFC